MDLQERIERFERMESISSNIRNANNGIDVATVINLDKDETYTYALSGIDALITQGIRDDGMSLKISDKATRYDYSKKIEYGYFSAWIDTKRGTISVLLPKPAKYEIQSTDCCPECGSHDLEINEFNCGRADHRVAQCCDCDWSIEI